MSKYLYVEFINSWDRHVGAEMGEDYPVKRRVVKIELTKEQVEQLKPKEVGFNRGKTVFEEVRLISVQEEE